MPHMMVRNNFEVLTHLPQLSHCGVVASDGVCGRTQTATTDLKHLANEEMYVVAPGVWLNVEDRVHEDEVRRRVERVLEYH